MAREKIADMVLRLGVAFAYLYPPLDAYADPNSWIGYFPEFMRGVVPDITLLHAFGAVEILIALWILSGKKVFYPAAVAAVLLCLIIAFNFNQFEILFRDLVIAFAAAALAIRHEPFTARMQKARSAGEA